MQRKLAPLQTVIAIEPIPNADVIQPSQRKAACARLRARPNLIRSR